MAGRLFRYLAAAFNARPKGMFVPPNWVGLGVVGLLGLLNPGIWLIGLGLELAYLFALVSSPRFQRVVDSRTQSSERKIWDERITKLLASLDGAGQGRYRALDSRCREMLNDPALAEPRETHRALAEALARLLWVYLQLLVTKQATIRVLKEGDAAARQWGASLVERQRELEDRLSERDLDADLRRSLEGQLDLLKQRRATHDEARAKVDFIDAELQRVEEQVQLVREQAVLAHDPDSASRRIDAIQGTLGGTTQWIRDQRRLSGELADTLEGTPPPMIESQ